MVLKSIAHTVQGLSRSSKLRLAWDVFMVWVALINLWMILFDLTYLWLRPTYFRYLPVVTRVYDPVKGITPNPLTTETAQLLREARERAEIDPRAPELANDAERLRSLTLRIFRENPFERSGQERLLDVLEQGVTDQTGLPRGYLDDPEHLETAVNRLWPLDVEAMSARLANQNPRLLSALDLCYQRSYSVGGSLTDHFWIIDLPFLILFWIEFLVRWRLSLKRREYTKWFFFPIVNWYDVLGLIPIAWFRPFRLLRAVSMYMRLRRSELSLVGKDIFSRTVAYFSNIITEEVSDRVALRILSEFGEEIEDGTHRRIIRDTVEPRRSEIQRVITSQIQQTLTNPDTIDGLRSLLVLNLENAVRESPSLHSVPLPKIVLDPLIRATGEIMIDTVLETVTATLDSEEGRRAVEDVASAMVDDVFYGPGLEEMEALVKEIALQVIGHMKEVVEVKKWMLPTTAPENGRGDTMVEATDADLDGQ
jgi:hypothetical protein